MVQTEVVLIKIEDGEDKHNQSGDQSIRQKEQFLLMIIEGEGCTHPIGVDRCSLEREEVDHHGEEDLRAATDADSEYHPYVLGG